MQKTYLITGGAGFIGSHIARELVKRQQKVIVVDNLSTGTKGNLEDIMSAITFLEADITNRTAMDEAMRNVDYVLHQGAIPSVPRSIRDPFASNHANITGTLTVLGAAKDAGVKRLVYAASSSAYGNINAEYKVETLPANPISPYALTKYAGELYCQYFTGYFNLETVALRYFNVFGPRQNPSSEYAAVIPKFITLMLQGKSPVIYGDGEQCRDFTYVQNNVEANLLAATSELGVGEVINIACGESVSLNEIVAIINKKLGTNIEPTYAPAREGDVKDSKADIGKAKQMLHYSPVVRFEQGIEETIKWYQNAQLNQKNQ